MIRKSPLLALVAVPAGVAAGIALVILLFGGLAGSGPSLEDDLQDLARGGERERGLAAVGLARKIAENDRAALAGEPAPWPVPPELAGTIDEAWAGLPAGEWRSRYALGALLARLGDPRGVSRLLELLDENGDAGPDDELRFQIVASLGAIGDGRATERVIEEGGSDDRGMRSLVAIVLQNLPGGEVPGALARLVEDPELEVRANAAISLAKRGDERGAGVLVELLEPETYRAEHDRDRRRFGSESLVRESRRKALAALARLGRAKDRARVEALAGDPDLELRAAALEALERWGGAVGRSGGDSLPR